MMVSEKAMVRNVAIYPWFKFAQSLVFWQAVWFLYFQDALSPAASIGLYAIYDISVTVLEVPLGIVSDKMGRRRTLIASAVAGIVGSVLLAFGGGFAVFALGQAFIGAATAFSSGTDSATLYESLVASGKGDQVEAEETRAFQYSVSGFALSAIVGGVLAMWSFPLTFWAAAAGLMAAFLLVWRMTEPPGQTGTQASRAMGPALRAASAQPVLRWIFVLAVVMYGFSHLPFVFGQPFIDAALGRVDLAQGTPVVSGAVSAVMMAVSFGASLVALRLRRRLGLVQILLLAFGLQVALIAVLSVTQSWLAIAVLFLRYVPNALSRPFVMARIQPLLPDTVRATYVSVQSLAGKLVFSMSLLMAAGASSDVAALPYSDIRLILGCYGIGGILIWAGLAATAHRAGVER
ncbi:MAG: MFS transporter [Sulfitobacter sp.]